MRAAGTQSQNIFVILVGLPGEWVVFGQSSTQLGPIRRFSVRMGQTGQTLGGPLFVR
jgi:hypothetical protein